MPVEIIPAAPEKMRLFWQAYFWILVSTFLALPFLSPPASRLDNSLQKWLKRAPRPMLASAVFFAIAYSSIIPARGWIGTLADPLITWSPSSPAPLRAPSVVSTPLRAPYLGLLAGFISGSESSAIAMLTSLHLSTAAEDRRLGSARRRRQRHRRRIGLRHLSRQAAERRRHHRPHRRGGRRPSRHLRHLARHHRCVRTDDAAMGVYVEARGESPMPGLLPNPRAPTINIISPKMARRHPDRHCSARPWHRWHCVIEPRYN